MLKIKLKSSPVHWRSRLSQLLRDQSSPTSAKGKKVWKKMGLLELKDHPHSWRISWTKYWGKIKQAEASAYTSFIDSVSITRLIRYLMI